VNIIRNTLLVILLIQFLIFLYVKLVHEIKPTTITYQSNNPNIQQQIDLETLVTQSIIEIINGAKELPQSSEYTLWDQEMIDNLNKEIQDFNHEIKKIVQSKIAIMDVEKKKVIAEISTSKKVENYAKEKLGQKYVWGATGPLTFDCSGFTQDVFLCTHRY